MLTFDGNAVTEARIALGSLAPTIVRAETAEDFLTDKTLTPEVCSEAAKLACAAVAPIDDVRGTAAYRLQTLQNLSPARWRSWPGDLQTGIPTNPSFSTRIR